MKYYLISNQSDEKSVGYYPQTEGLPKGKTSKWFDEPNSMTNLSDDTLPQFTPNLHWELKKGSTLTDIISASNITATGFLMSKKAKNIFDDFNIITHKYHNAELIYNQHTLQYYYLQLVHQGLKDIDFTLSIFYISNLFGLKQSEVILKSENELTKKRLSLPLDQVIRAERLILSPNHSPLDLFFFPIIHNEIFASKALVNELQKNNISGLEYFKQNIISI